MRQHGPRVGDSPLPGHWAAPVGGFAGMAYIAHGLDCLAGETGMADGLSVLLKGCDITAGQVQAASREMLREWFYRCCARYSGEPAARHWDVVAFACGIHDADSGW